MALTRIAVPLAMALALSQATAMNLTFSGKGCSDNDDFSSAAYFNATGTTKFHVAQLGKAADEPWYYTLTLMDEKGPGGVPWITRWLSVPESFWASRTAEDSPVCMYSLLGRKKSLKNVEGKDTCQGVIADKCEEAFENADEFDTGDSCPSVPDAGDCGDGGLYSPTDSLRLTKDTCHTTALPGVKLPYGYLTFKIVSVGYDAPFNATATESYDIALRESIPTFFLIGKTSEQKQISQSVCAVPNRTQKDSRTLEDGKQDGAEDYENGTDGDGDSLGASLATGKAAALALAMASLIGGALV